MRVAAAVVVMLSFSGSAFGQGATLRVSHEHPTGLVLPGETVRLTVLIDWTPATAVLGIVGGIVRTTPDVGAASNAQIAIPFPGGIVQPAFAILNPGTPTGGSVQGIHINSMVSNPLGNLIAPPWNITSNFPLVSFDWTAPNAPGASIDFDWESSSAFPTPLFSFNLAQGPVGTLPTTYVGTTLTVTPTPAGFAAISLLAAMKCRRRR